MPLLRWIYVTLERDANQRVERDYFIDKLHSDFGEAAAEQLDIAVGWGRYADLFAYDKDADELYLEA